MNGKNVTELVQSTKARKKLKTINAVLYSLPSMKDVSFQVKANKKLAITPTLKTKQIIGISVTTFRPLYLIYLFDRT